MEQIDRSPGGVSGPGTPIAHPTPPAGSPRVLPGAGSPESGVPQSPSDGSIAPVDESCLEDPFAAWVNDSRSGPSAEGPGDSLFSEASSQTPYGVFRIVFHPHEVPLGLVLDWTMPLPVVEGVLPGSYAEAHPEILPGLIIQAINDTGIPEGADPLEVQKLFEERPLVVEFNRQSLLQDQVELEDWDQDPNQIYQLGECYRALERLVMRLREDLNSPIVAECLQGAVLQVIGRGNGESGRRLKVRAVGREGWVSCSAAGTECFRGQVLMATKPALLIGQPTNIHRDNQLLEPAVESDIKKNRKDIIDQRLREEMLLAQKFSPASNRKGNYIGAKIGRVGTKLMDAQHTVRRTLVGPSKNDEGDSSDEELTEDEIKAAMGRASAVVETTMSQVQLRTMAKKALGMSEDEEDEADNSRRARWERRFGLQWFRLRIKMQRMRVEAEGSYFPACTWLCSQMRFEVFIGCMIVMNAGCLALETFYDSDNTPVYLNVSEHIFTTVFLVEWIIRVMDVSWLYFLNGANLFDTFLVWITGVLVMWILGPAGVNLSSIRRVGAFRMLRLARLCKAIRLMPVFRELWMLVSGIITCASLLSWSLIVGAVFHYTFAVACIELIAKDLMFEDDAAVQRNFGTLPRAMLSLFQIMIFDSWSGIVTPIINKDPKSCLIFFVFNGLAGIVLFNLLTAIVVQNAFSAAAADEDAKTQVKLQESTMIKAELYNIFRDLDEDESGCLSMEEFLDCLDDFAFIRKMKMLDIDLEELPDIFAIIDDGDGQVDQDEFIMGMMHLQGAAMSPEVLKATSSMSKENAYFTDLEDSFVENALETFRNVDIQVDRLHGNMNAMMQLTAEVITKLDQIGLRKNHLGTAKVLKEELQFIDDPDLEEIHRQAKAKKKEERKAHKKHHKKNQSEDDWEMDERQKLPPGSYVDDPIPPEWFVREGKSPAAMNPGKTRLAKDASLKLRLTAKTAKKTPAKKIDGVRKEFSHAWMTLDLALRTDGTLDTGVADDDLPPCPDLFNQMPWVLAGGDRPAPPATRAPVLPTDQAGGGQASAEGVAEAAGEPGDPPRAQPLPADAMAMLGLHANRGGVTRTDDSTN